MIAFLDKKQDKDEIVATSDDPAAAQLSDSRKNPGLVEDGAGPLATGRSAAADALALYPVRR